MEFINLEQVEDKVQKGVKWKKYNVFYTCVIIKCNKFSVFTLYLTLQHQYFCTSINEKNEKRRKIYGGRF